MNPVILHLLLLAIGAVESGNNPKAVNPVCGGTGILQITEIMVDDCNRIVGDLKWSYQDRFDVVQSFAMARVYFDHYCEGFTAEQMARCWNGGPKGHLKECTEGYWRRVSAIYIASLEQRLL